jgi:hypothetical protein
MQLTGAGRSCDHLVNEHVPDSATSTDIAHAARLQCCERSVSTMQQLQQRPQLGSLSRCFVEDLGHVARVRIAACASSGSAAVCGAQRPRTLGCSATLTPAQSTKTTPRPAFGALRASGRRRRRTWLARTAGQRVPPLGAPAIATVAKRSPGAGDQHDRGVAEGVVRSGPAESQKRSSARRPARCYATGSRVPVGGLSRERTGRSCHTFEGPSSAVDCGIDGRRVTRPGLPHRQGRGCKLHIPSVSGGLVPAIRAQASE